MLKNFFYIAFRNLFKNKAFSLINISGLAIGMAAAALIFLVIDYQKSYDQFHLNKSRIYEFSKGRLGIQLFIFDWRYEIKSERQYRR